MSYIYQVPVSGSSDMAKQRGKMYNSTELMAILVNGMDEISKVSEPKAINNRIEKLIIDLTHSEKAELLLFDRSGYKLRSKSNDTTRYDMDATEGLLGLAVVTMRPSFYNHIRSEKKYEERVDNPTEMKLKGQLLYPVIHEGKNLGLLRLSRTIKSTGNYTQNDITLLQSIQPYLVKMVQILNDEQKSVAIDTSKVSEEISNLEKSAKKSGEALNDTMLFLSNTVHDIRTPANSLYGFLDLMEEQIQDKKLLKFIQNAKQSAAFINTLTDTILERVKYDNEVRTSEREQVNSVSFFSSVANIFSANMSSKEMDYIVKIDPALPKEIVVEAVKLKRILINLIGNAYKFTPTGKMIELSVAYEKERVGISVKDTGLGIEESRQKEIFKAFEQAQDDTSLHYGGTGLGLAICSKYVADLGGELQLESQVEKGSTFYFDIPVEIKNKSLSFSPFFDLQKQITIYTNDTGSVDAMHISESLQKCGMPSENIVISDKVKKSTTHLICFEHKLNENVLKVAEAYGMKLILLEEKLFSLSGLERYKAFPVLSKNHYYDDVLYGAVSSKRKPTVLIVDDNKLNVQLLEMILEGEYCEITCRYNGEDGFIALQEALLKGQPFDLLFSDKHMEELSGTEMLKAYRELENSRPGIKPVHAVSISGDADMSAVEKELFDQKVHKPFKKDVVIQTLKKIK